MKDSGRVTSVVELWGRTLGALALSGLCGCSVASPGNDPEGPSYCEDVQSIIETKCVRCHDDPQHNGAPFSLRNYEDFDAIAPGVPEVTVAEAARDAVATSLMPLVSIDLEPPVEPLSASEKEKLLSWFDNDRPRGNCD